MRSRLRRRAAVGARSSGAVMAALLVAASAEVAAQTHPDGSAAPPPGATPANAPSPTLPEEPTPTEFPDVVEGGVVSASAPPPPAKLERPWPTQRSFGLLATEGSFNGIGLGFRAGSLRVGVETAFSVLPLLTTFTVDPEQAPDFELLWSYQANASFYLGLHRLDAKTDLGIAFGYKYNTLLKHGGTVAFYIQRELGAHWTLQGFIGPCIFPDAEAHIRRETGWVGGSVSSGLAWHQAGVGVSLAFFP